MDDARYRSDHLLFLPLGGSGEIGMNLNLYGHRGRWLMVDCGVTFGGESNPGVDVITPDPAFIAEHRHLLAGAGADPRARGPSRRGAVSLAAAALSDLGDAVRGLDPASQARRGRLSTTDIELTVVPEDAPLRGRPVRHRADPPHAFDPRADGARHPHRRPARCCTPATGRSTRSRWSAATIEIEQAARARRRRRARDGRRIRPTRCGEGESGSEAEVRAALTRLFARLRGPHRRRLLRLERRAASRSIALAARANGRDVGAGRPFALAHARRGQGERLPRAPRRRFLREDEAGYVPRERIAADLHRQPGRAARGARAHRAATTTRTSCSSPATPASSRRARSRATSAPILALQNELVGSASRWSPTRPRPPIGGPIHVSGHPCRDELARDVPVGAAAHRDAGARRGAAHGRARRARARLPGAVALVPANGDVIRLAASGPELVDSRARRPARGRGQPARAARRRGHARARADAWNGARAGDRRARPPRPARR